MDKEAEFIKKLENEYLDGGYVTCPVCESSDIEGRQMQVDSACSWQQIECIECGAEWHDIYKLVGCEIRSYDTDLVEKLMKTKEV